MTKHVIVRPSTQSTFFPIGSVATKSKKDSYPCSIGARCGFTCNAYGDSITKIEIKEISPNGTQITVPSAKIHPYRAPYMLEIYWVFEAKEDTGDANGITKFVCSASDDIHGTQAANVIEIHAVVYPSIIFDKSYVQVESDQNSVTMRKVTFVCAVRGRPLPTVTFRGGDSVAFRNLGSEPDNVIITGKDEAVATKVIAVDVDLLFESIIMIEDENAVAPYCRFYDHLTSSSYKNTFYVEMYN
ncbi:hypothetical protein PoB_004621200 [Plakobranchus ocellatus]|uniref:Ig-like domain-containing protein n=1 Tax=Plakobranchus ocellatus TaxID=259542 RepID=A0AAV4BJY5_9GAST|nr:hypothetical protein PoB_004621200 [Plakobranchus ocellatus]